jgi:hypothetical protein
LSAYDRAQLLEALAGAVVLFTFTVAAMLLP